MLNRRDRNTGDLFDPWAHLGAARRRMLEQSWAGVFRKHALGVLVLPALNLGFHAEKGRPGKVPQVLLGVLVLQQMHDTTDVQTLEMLAFNEQWHYALNVRQEDEAYLCDKTLWHRFIDQEMGRKELQEAIQPLRSRMKEALTEGAACGQKKTAGLCKALLKREAALWRFASVPGLEPTNNLAERMLRPAVVWRKKSFGSNSQTGCGYVERMLSVIQTLRQRGHPVMGYLASAIEAHRKGQAPPAIPPRQDPDSAKAAELRKVA